MLSTGESLKQFWLTQGIKLRPAAPEEEIGRFENAHKVLFPHDLRDYYLTVDGFADNGCDDNVIYFLPLSEVDSESEIWRPKTPERGLYFAFADYSISCHVYMIKLAREMPQPTPVFIAYDSSPIKIADSFSEFVIGYLANDYEVLFPS